MSIKTKIVRVHKYGYRHGYAMSILEYYNRDDWNWFRNIVCDKTRLKVASLNSKHVSGVMQNSPKNKIEICVQRVVSGKIVNHYNIYYYY